MAAMLIQRSMMHLIFSYFSHVTSPTGGSGARLEQGDLEKLSADYMTHTLEADSPLAYYGYYEAIEAKKKNFELLPEALNAFRAGEDIRLQNFYVCTSCGNMRSADEPPEHCHICGGAPDTALRE